MPKIVERPSEDLAVSHTRGATTLENVRRKGATLFETSSALASAMRLGTSSPITTET